ncbi:MAG: hypothetical protein ACRDGD_12180 [Candidatus Limnocylindria bacterium]
MRRLDWFLERPTAVRRYAADLLTESIGLRATFLDAPPTEPAVYVHHGSGAAGPEAIVVPEREPSDVPADVATHRHDGRRVLDADVISATIALVTDAVNRSPAPGDLDRHGRLRAAASHLGRRGLVAAPIVNRYAIALRLALADGGRFRMADPWPDGRRAAIVLSHDVDRPDKYAVLRAAGSLRLPPPQRLPWFLARTARDLAHRLRDRAPDDFWLFEPLAASEEERGMVSTFLFAVVPAFAPYGSTNDVLYDASWPHLRRAMRALHDSGIEIALHASYNAHADASRFVTERARLQELSGTEIRGLRHHFWQVGPDVAATLRAHEAAGFAYDSSLAYNDDVGLRRGIALPYHPWDEGQQRPLRTLQVPTICLDSAACAGMTSVDAAVGMVWERLVGVIEAGGVAALDWHVRCAVPANERYRSWGQVYQELLERLAQRSDVWVTGLGDVAAWSERRRALIDDPAA